jgi:tetratricopeptide (TPR) repeat protein
MSDYDKIYGKDPLTDIRKTMNELKQQGMELLHQQRFPEVLAIAEKACEQDPNDPEAWLMRAVACSQSGQLNEAVQFCRRALDLVPSHTGAYLTLAGILQMQGKLDEAIIAYQDLLIQKPEIVEAMNNLGSLLRTVGRLDEAQDQLSRALLLRPGGPIILNNLGLVEKDRGNLPGAVDFYRQSLNQNPGYAEAHYNLANILQLQGNIQDAEAHYRKAIECKTDFALAYHGLGQLLGSQGRMDEALTALEHAQGLQPDFKDISASIAEIHEKQGDHDKAWQVLEPLLKEPAFSPGTALCFAKLAPRLERQHEAIDILKQQLLNPALPFTVTRDVHFAIGDLYDSTGEFEQAFEHYRQGNTDNAGEADFQANLGQIQLVREIFHKDSPSYSIRSSNTTEQPVFIVGLPRSGTTLVEQIVASHPQITGAGEVTYLGDILNSFPERFGPGKTYPSCMDELGEAKLDELAQEYLQKLSTHAPDATRITDKMPHNFLHLGFIDRLFPNARVIHCVRDPMDTCLSIYFHNFSTNHPYASSLENLGTYYKAYKDLMEHWKTSLRIPILEVGYEDLTSNLETVSRNLTDFCGVEWDENCLNFHQSGRIVTTPSYEQVRQPIYTKSVGRWKNYEKFLQPLKLALE